MTAAESVSGTSPRPVDDQGKISLTLRVNGREERVTARPHHTLLEVLRNELHLTGPREGCGVGMCGACTVLVDGRPVSGCLLPAALAEGRELTTIAVCISIDVWNSRDSFAGKGVLRLMMMT